MPEPEEQLDGLLSAATVLLEKAVKTLEQPSSSSIEELTTALEKWQITGQTAGQTLSWTRHDVHQAKETLRGLLGLTDANLKVLNRFIVSANPARSFYPRVLQSREVSGWPL